MTKPNVKSKNSNAKQKFRAAAKRGGHAVVYTLSEQRAQLLILDFADCIHALKLYAPIQSNQLFATGAPSFNNLVWSRPALEQMTLDRELAWALCWLTGQSGKINKFRDVCLNVQSLILEEKFKEASSLLDGYVANSGWSLWAVELRCALEQLQFGTEGQKKWSSKLQQSAANTIPGLLIRIFSERNEESVSHDSFYSKCRDSFPRYKTTSNWMPRYLLYRSLGLIEDAHLGYATVLARDATSSLVDYYESFIDCLKCITNDEKLSYLRASAREIVVSLRANGFSDYRLTKLEAALGGNLAPEFNIEKEGASPGEVLSANFLGKRNAKSLGNKSIVQSIVDNFLKSKELGVKASGEISALLKLGVNLKSLDLGTAIGTASQDGVSDLLSERVASLETSLLEPEFTIEDAATFPDEAGKSLIKFFCTSHPDLSIRQKCCAIIKIVEGAAVNLDWDALGTMHLWLGRQLIVSGRCVEAYDLGEYFSEQGDYWRRQGAKLKLWALIKQNKMCESIRLAAIWIMEDPMYGVELPIEALFKDRDWGQFRDCDVMEVGIVSNYAFSAYGDQKNGYICKMACRKFALSGQRNSIVNEFESEYDEFKKKVAISFLSDVWIEENLSMNHFLESTDDMLDERMRVCQLLLTWNSERETDYVEVIKELTLNKTLRKGLRQINETRVFVNESAITRWAEKELSQEYERWEVSKDKSPSAQLDDEFVRQYVVDPQNEEFLRELGSGKPTEADILLTNIFERLFRRFLTDPTDGLDCYLSLRIRHGSLRGTLLGPLEEQGLLYSSSSFSSAAFDERWEDAMRLSTDERNQVLKILEVFTKKLKAISDELINERVQINSPEKPKGAISPFVMPSSGKLLARDLEGQAISFPTFTYLAYYIFWKYVENGLTELADYIRLEVKDAVQEAFDSTVASIRLVSPRTLPLVTVLTTVATTTQSQCDAISLWFQAPGQSKDDKYKLSAAIEIARASTKNVHRAFPAEVSLQEMPEEDPPLGTLALTVLSDCLFVIFENAWKYSGLGADIGKLRVSASVDGANKLLTLKVENKLSDNVRRGLLEGKLDDLKERYLSKTPVELISREGGSGFAKLARLSRYVDRAICKMPLDFGVADDSWFTLVTIPLVERNGAYETF